VRRALIHSRTSRKTWRYFYLNCKYLLLRYSPAKNTTADIKKEYKKGRWSYVEYMISNKCVTYNVRYLSNIFDK
jgi:hypothetical protein